MEEVWRNKEVTHAMQHVLKVDRHPIRVETEGGFYTRQNDVVLNAVQAIDSPFFIETDYDIDDDEIFMQCLIHFVVTPDFLSETFDDLLKVSQGITHDSDIAMLRIELNTRLFDVQRERMAQFVDSFVPQVYANMHGLLKDYDFTHQQVVDTMALKVRAAYSETYSIEDLLLFRQCC